MPDREVLLSWKENRDVEAYAARHGTTPEELIATLAMDNLKCRLRSNKKRGEVRTIRLPKRE